MDPLLPLWLIAIASIVAGAGAGILFERTRGSAAKRAAKFEADLVRVRSELMHYQDQTKHHFGKSAELLGRMATDYREFLDHFVTGAEELCGPNMKELNASGLDRPLLDGAGTASAPATASVPMASVASAVSAREAVNALPPLDSDPFVENAAK